MVNEADPITDNWYLHLDKGQRFLVIEVDEDNGLVELQYFDGNIDEIELSQWHEMELERIEEPENWSGPMDIAEIDDLGTSVTDTNPDDWLEPIQDLSDSNRYNPEIEIEQVQDDWNDDLPNGESWQEVS